MKLELHHINLSTRDVKELEAFYKDILFLDTQTDDLPSLEKKNGQRRKRLRSRRVVTYLSLTLTENGYL